MKEVWIPDLIRPLSIYQYSYLAPRLPVKNVKFLSLNSQRRLGYKENNTKYISFSSKPRSHLRILISIELVHWPIDFWLFYFSVYSLVFVSIEKLFQTLEMFHRLSKHLEFRQKYSAAARRIFNSLLGVSGYPNETVSLVCLLESILFYNFFEIKDHH